MNKFELLGNLSWHTVGASDRAKILEHAAKQADAGGDALTNDEVKSWLHELQNHLDLATTCVTELKNRATDSQPLMHARQSQIKTERKEA